MTPILGNFIHRYLDPVDSLGELLFGLIMALTLTLGVRVLTQRPDIDPQEMVGAMVGCNVAWGIIDAVLYLLGSVFSRVAGSRMARFRPSALALRLALRGGRVTVENPENRATLVRLGVEPARVKLIRGSGIDTARYQPLPDPPEAPLAGALVGRMLRSKGVLDAVAALHLA